ncbi:Ras family protein [Ancylostoma ceylanicum]|uniref:Ras family protein n=1 Tax=Ancylostoma ceylanicum TaxID=53326 RepID=A0A0D6MBX6_9BILA|nr:Ras family protein [Ancylostoma ceylanicum]
MGSHIAAIFPRFKTDCLGSGEKMSAENFWDESQHWLQSDHMIWDTAGQERFRSVTAAYYRDADALLLVFDVSNRASFENVRREKHEIKVKGEPLGLIPQTLCELLESWLAQIREYGKESVQVTLVGNKCDLGSSRTVRSDEARHLAASYSIPYIETSAKTGHNVNQAFLDIARA